MICRAIQTCVKVVLHRNSVTEVVCHVWDGQDCLCKERAQKHFSACWSQDCHRIFGNKNICGEQPISLHFQHDRGAFSSL